MRRPHIELSLHGERTKELLSWIKRRYEVSILTAPSAEASIPVEDTEFWEEMEANRVGNLLAGARLKAGLTQASLARLLRIRQNMISDYERGKRRLSAGMARRLSKTLRIKEDRLRYGPGRSDQAAPPSRPRPRARRRMRHALTAAP